MVWRRFPGATATCMPAEPAAPTPAACAGATAGVCWHGRRLAAGAVGRGRDDMVFDPVGFWGCERVLGPELRGEFTLRRDGAQWRAQLGGAEAIAPVAEGPLSLAFDEGRGAFRGPAGLPAGPMVGHWIQPPGPMHGN